MKVKRIHWPTLFLLLLLAACSKDEIKTYELVTSSNPRDGGSINPADGTYNAGTKVLLKAEAEAGFIFKEWEGSLEGSTNPLSFTMDGNKAVIAIFELQDTDQDGVADINDLCPNTISGADVDNNGCSENQKDTDGDGITNALDSCPQTAEGAAVDENGCSDAQRDQDGDGVFDNVDACPNTMENEEVDEVGCAQNQKDSDGDGVTDDEDLCQGTIPGAPVDVTGCADNQTDTDGDTITDDVDQCPNTAAGDVADANGCAPDQKDSDNDGITDANDLCENTPEGATVNDVGCAPSQTDTDGDGVYDDVDQCPNTAAGALADANGCSPAQTDQTAPVATDVEVLDITATSFKISWSLDEGSKGYVRFGTAPGVYVASTLKENNFLDTHVQTLGGGNPFPLQPNTTYYWQIYVEDRVGNTGFTVERSTTTLAAQTKTFVPDDVFEQNLIDLGYDDVLDDYVLTENIANVLTLDLVAANQYENWGSGDYSPILDYTGLEDFTRLQELTLRSMSSFVNNDNIDLSKNSNLKKLVFWWTDYNGLDLSKNSALEELFLRGADVGEWWGCRIYNLDLRPNTNLKTLRIILPNYIDDLDLTLARAPSIENLILGNTPGYDKINLRSNNNLVNLRLIGDPMSINFIDLKNGSNEKIKSIYIDPINGPTNICIEADLPAYLQTITNTIPDISVTITDDCGS
jgi:hypothetical protein